MDNEKRTVLAEVESTIIKNPNSLEAWLEKMYAIEALKEYDDEELLDEYTETARRVVALIGEDVRMLEAVGQHIYSMAKDVTLYCIGEVERDFESTKLHFEKMTKHYESLSANEEMDEETEDQYLEISEKESEFMHHLFEINHKAFIITQTIPPSIQLRSTLLMDLETDYINTSILYSEKERERNEFLMKYEESETSYLERHGDYLEKHGKLSHQQIVQAEEKPYIPDARATLAISQCKEMGADSALKQARKGIKENPSEIEGLFLLMAAHDSKKDYSSTTANVEYTKTAKTILAADVDEACRETVYRMAVSRATEVAQFCYSEITKNKDAAIAKYNEIINYYNALSGNDNADESIEEDFKTFKDNENRICKSINKIIESGNEIADIVPGKQANAWASTVMKDYFELCSQYSDAFCERMELGSAYSEAHSSYIERSSEYIHRRTEAIEQEVSAKRKKTSLPTQHTPNNTSERLTENEQEELLNRSEVATKVGIAALAIVVLVFVIYMLLNWSFVMSMLVGIPVVGIAVFIGLKLTEKISDDIAGPVYEQHVQDMIQERQKKDEQKRRVLDDDLNRIESSMKDNVIKKGTETIVIDSDNWILINKHAKKITINHHLYNFEDILGYKVTDDAQSIQYFSGTSSTAETHTDTGSMLGRAAIGGIIGGTTGAIIGGTTAKKNTTIVTPRTSVTSEIKHNYRIDVTIDNLSHPLETILVGNNSEIANQIASILEIIDRHKN